MYLNIIYNLYEKPIALHYGFQNQENWHLIFFHCFYRMIDQNFTLELNTHTYTQRINVGTNHSGITVEPLDKCRA